jgi:hypothetical protein
MYPVFLRFMATVGFNVTTALSTLAKELPEPTPIISSATKTFLFNWNDNNEEVDSYEPLAEFLANEKGLTTSGQIVQESYLFRFVGIVC